MSDMRAKYVIIGLSIAVGIVGALYLTSPTASYSTMAVMPTMLGHVQVTVADADGNVKYYAQTDNVITDIGLDCALSNLFGTADGQACTAANTFKFISLSTTAGTDVDTTAATITGTEVAREEATTAGDGGQDPSNAIDDTVSLAEEFTVVDDALNAGNDDALEDTEEASSTALFDGGGVGTADNMLAVANLPQTLSGLNEGDTVLITWTITAT